MDWHSLVSPRGEASSEITVPCFGGAAAVAWIEDDIRMGSLSAFPLMASAEHHGWGLAWQTFPVALWRPEGDWGDFQWVVEEDEQVKAHPAIVRNTAYLNNALSTSTRPPIVGETYALQRGGNLLVLRIMPATDVHWDRVRDQWRIIDNHAEVEALPVLEGWSQLLMEYADRSISVHYLDLMEIRGPELTRNAHGGMDWRVSWSAEGEEAPETNELQKQMLVSLWGMSAEGKVEEAAVLVPLETVSVHRNPEQRAYLLEWKWPGIEWRVAIDPLSDEPLIEAPGP
jgi:hypothetical protein